MKNKKRKKTPRYALEQNWSTMMMVDDELVDRINIWKFYYFVGATVVALLEDFMDVVEFKTQGKSYLSYRRPPVECISAEDFNNMISSIKLLVRYDDEGGLIYNGREVNFERGDQIWELTEALYKFANLLPYLNDRHFPMSEDRYEDASNGRNCDFNELRNLDKTIGRRIFPTLQAFAEMSIFVPRYFHRMYWFYPIPDSVRTNEYDCIKEWNKTLETMVESWRWILERTPSVSDEGWEDVPEKIFYGLHLFAEYLPEMQND